METKQQHSQQRFVVSDLREEDFKASGLRNDSAYRNLDVQHFTRRWL